MNLKPVSISQAKEFVSLHHRHHKAPLGGLFAVGIEDENTLIGVAIIGRPVARMLQDGYTAEVTRLCVLEGHHNGCSMLYSAAWRAAKSLGYKRMISYILESETGTSLKASGWKLSDIKSNGGSWSRPSRERTDDHPTEPKKRWEIGV